MSAVFISYRRGDSAGHTGRLYDHLRERFGQETIFRDIDTIEPGADFVDAVESGIKDCSTLIVVIGPQWLNTKDNVGNRRLDDPHDFVRIEIASALKANLRIIPVLVKGAEMPSAAALPDDIAALARRHALDLSDSRWDYDMSRLIEALSSIIESKNAAKISTPDDIQNIIAAETSAPKQAQVPHHSKKPSNPLIKIVAIGAVMLLAAIFWKYLPDGSSEPNDVETTVSSEPSKLNGSQVKQNPQFGQSTGELPDPKKNPSVNDQQLKIIDLLKEANEDISAQRLTTPENKNALNKYQMILQLDPTNNAAKKGIKLIARKYLDLANSAVNSGDLSSAAVYRDRAKSVDAKIEGLEKFNANYLQVQQKIASEQKAQQQVEIEAQRRQDARQEKRLREQRVQENRDKEKAALRQIEVENTRNKKAQQQARLAAEKAAQKLARQNCLSECEQNLSACNNVPQTGDTQCVAEIKTICDKVQEVCLGDPQIYILWGDLGAESECLGQWHQCEEEQQALCADSQNSSEPDCAAASSSCEQSCR